MTASPELGRPPEEMKRSEQSNDAPTTSALPESGHDQNHTTLLERDARPESDEKHQKFSERVWRFIKRPTVLAGIGGASLATVGVLVLGIGSDRDQASDRQTPANPDPEVSLTTEAQSPPSIEPTVPPTSWESTVYPNGSTEGSSDTNGGELKQFGVDPNRFIVPQGQFIELPQTDESAKLTMRNICDSFSAAASALDSNGEARPELTNLLFKDNKYEGSQGLTQLAAYASKMTYNKQGFPDPNTFVYYDCELLDNTTSQYYPGANIYKVQITGHVVDATTGESKFHELSFITSLITEETEKTYPDGSTHHGLQLVQAWPEGQELPS